MEGFFASAPLEHLVEAVAVLELRLVALEGLPLSLFVLLDVDGVSGRHRDHRKVRDERRRVEEEPLCLMRLATVGVLVRETGAMKAAQREQARGAVVVMLAAGALWPERADHVWPELADELDDVRRHPLDRRVTQTAVGPFQEPALVESDDLGGLAPFLRALARELLGCPRACFPTEPHANVAACERQESGDVTFVFQLHGRPRDPEGLVVWVRVHEEDGGHPGHANVAA